MQMIVRYPSGRLADCVLLAANNELMRIVVRRRNETLELRLSGEDWISEKGELIEIASLVTSREMQGAGRGPAPASAAAPKVLRAGAAH